MDTGFAYFSPFNPTLDGTLVKANFLNSSTVAHEVGHSFTLRHTFEGGCSAGATLPDCETTGDFICDTYPVSPSSGCPSSYCSGAHPYTAKDTKNIMAYVNCEDRFSMGQVARMKADFAAKSYRQDLANSNGHIPPGIPTVQLSASTNSGEEASTTVITLTATTSTTVSGNQTVNVNVAGTGITGSDYTLSNTQITILDGQATGTVTFTIQDDSDLEGTETATISIDNPSSGIALGVTISQDITITDNEVAPNPVIQLSVSDNNSFEEDATMLTLTATTSSVVSGNQIVDITVSGTGITDTDYTLSDTQITILDGETTGIITFTIQDDSDLEGTETATISIDNPSSGIDLGATTSQSILIIDNDVPDGISLVNLSASTNMATEENRTTIILSAIASSAVSGNQTVDISISGTDIDEQDYVLSNPQITILDGETTGTVTFTVQDDNLPEEEEMVTIALHNPSSGIILGTIIEQIITITDNEEDSVTPTSLDIANILTPNGDGRNDTWVIENLSGDYQIRVFTKNGQIIFETNNYNQDWDGKNQNGNPLQAGVYYYSIVVSGQKKPKTGYITLVR